MTKKVLSAIICVCLMFSVFACVASAAAVPAIEGDIPAKVRVCPGAVFEIPAPDITGNVFSQGWEIKVVGGDWIPYDGEPLDAEEADANVRYYAANELGEYSYSNEALIILEHSPSGSYKYDDENHWRECADCGGQTNVGKHTTIDDIMSEKTEENICTVCGHERSGFYNIIVILLNWIMSIVGSLLG